MKTFKIFILFLFLNLVACNSEKVVSGKTEEIKTACCSKRDCKKDDGACLKKESEGSCCSKKECSKNDESKKKSIK